MAKPTGPESIPAADTPVRKRVTRGDLNELVMVRGDAKPPMPAFVDPRVTGARNDSEGGSAGGDNASVLHSLILNC